jgi:diacylglycerol kinase family enzyme
VDGIGHACQSAKVFWFFFSKKNIAAMLDRPPQARRRSFAVVLNTRAGALIDQGDPEHSLREAFAEAGLTARFVPDDVGSLAARFAQALAMAPDAVLVAGGDGTIACAAQALAGTGMPLAILPAGTMNLLASDLGIRAGALQDAARLAADGVARDIDVAEVNGHVFLCASMLGLPARLGRHRERARDGAPLLLRWVRLARAGLRALRTHAARDVVLQVGAARPSRAVSVTVTANMLDDRTGRTFGRSCLDGGQLGVYIIDRAGLRDLPRLLLGVLRGTWRRDRAVREQTVGELTVRARRPSIRVMNDGEGILLAPPLHYRIRPGALRVIAPAAADERAAG